VGLPKSLYKASSLLLTLALVSGCSTTVTQDQEPEVQEAPIEEALPTPESEEEVEENEAKPVPPSLDEIVERYKQIATQCEFGDCPGSVSRPDSPVAVSITTPATPEQETAVRDALNQWNSHCDLIPLTLGDGANAEMKIAFDDLENFGQHLAPHMREFLSGNEGAFSYSWDGAFNIYDMRIAISSDLTGASLRHFVLEEVTQAMGLMNDVRDSSSIFDSGRGRTTEYSILDQEVVKLHCSGLVRPGLDPDDF